jgi:hypothetical protein
VVWTALVWLRIGPVEGSSEHGMNLRVPLNAGKFLSSCTTGDFSRRVQLHEVSYVLTFCHQK